MTRDLSGLLEANRRAARHRQGLAVLTRAGIEGDAVPATFDGAALRDELDRLSLRHEIRSAGELPPATKEQRRQANAIISAARRLAVPLREALDEDGSPVPSALAEGMGQPDPDWFPHSLAGQQRLRLLLAELDHLAGAVKPAEDRIGSLDQGSRGVGASWPAENGITSWVELLGRDLPTLYQQALGRPCRVHMGSKKVGPMPSEGLRFIVECAAECDVAVEPGTAHVAWKRWRRKRGKTG